VSREVYITYDSGLLEAKKKAKYHIP